jgi:glycosyltransferase involved in cell wall biosynthesis
MKILHIGLCVQPKPYNGFQQAFTDVVGEENYREISTGEENLNAKVLILANEFKPNIVFMQIQAPNIILHNVCQRLKDMGCFIINWTGDKRHEVPQWMIDLAPYVSLTSFSNMDDVNTMRSLGFKSDYLEIGYNESIYTPVGEALNMPEIIFMGNNYGRGYFPMSGFRIDMVDFLRQEYGNRFGVYGSGWAYGNGNFNHSQLEEAKAYRGAKIAINCSHFDSLNYNSDRLLRILGSGTMCLSYDHLGMKETYNHDKVSYFKRFDELQYKIELALEYPEDSKLMALNGYNFVKNTFTFKNQVENIINLAK